MRWSSMASRRLPVHLQWRCRKRAFQVIPLTPEFGLQVLVQVAMMVLAFGRLETRIAVITTKLRYIEGRLKMHQTEPGEL